MSGTQRSKAERALERWAENNNQRDLLVLNAIEAEVPINRIHQLTGIARSTIYKIIMADR